MNRVTPAYGLERTERLLDLVPYVATHQGISLEELARDFSLTTAQLTEDLTTLWMCGLPGYTALELMDLSFDTGFVSISNADTLAKPRMLNRDEVLALILGLQTLSGGAVPENAQLITTITQLISKLTNLLDARAKGRVQAGTYVLAQERATIERAIVSRGAVEISYHSIARDEISKRIIHPLEFSTFRENDYVLAFCELTRSYRTFRLDRIKQVQAIESQAETAPLGSPARDSEKLLITVRMSSRLRDVAERFNLELSPPGEPTSMRLEVETFSSDWAIREIMSFGGDVDLLSPLELRESLAERASRTLRGYQA